MVQSLLFWAALISGMQALPSPQPQNSGSECINETEKKRLSEQDKIDGRIKVYRTISERYHQAVLSAVAQKRFNEIPALVACWKGQLNASLKDIEDNINRKKKSGALIDYEIQLRKSIVDVTDARLKANFEQQDDFDTWIAQAKNVRQKFVDILFQR